MKDKKDRIGVKSVRAKERIKNDHSHMRNDPQSDEIWLRMKLNDQRSICDRRWRCKGEGEREGMRKVRSVDRLRVD